MMTPQALFLQKLHPLGRPAGLVSAGLLCMALGTPAAWAKELQLDGVHYQPEGLVIQVAGGKLKAPQVEAWPNQRAGVNTQLIIVRLPGCVGDHQALQQAGIQEISGHPEVKQFWITPFDTDPQAAQGTQVVLEVETRPDAPEFTPQVLSQGEAQWVITLQSVATQPRRLPSAVPKESGLSTDEKRQANSPPSDFPPEPSGDASDSRASRVENGPANASATTTLLAELNQSRQRQAALGAQLVAAQQALKDTQAREDALQERLNGYENILQEAGINAAQDDPLEAAAVIQNLKSALVRVAQKLKAAEAALAERPGSATPFKATNSTAPGPTVASVPPVSGVSLDEPAVAPPPAVAPTIKRPAALVPPSQKMTRVYMATGGDYAQENRLIQALQAEPASARPYLNLADFYVATGQWGKAKSALLTLSRIQPENGQSFYYLTLLYLHEQNRRAAAVAFRHYAQKHPQDVQGIAQLKKAMQGGVSPQAFPGLSPSRLSTTGPGFHNGTQSDVPQTQPEAAQAGASMRP